MKVLVVLGVVAVVLGVIGWQLLYAPTLANNESILRLRNRYFYLLGQRLPPGTLIYSVRPTSLTEIEGERSYVYKLMGRVVEVDYKEQIMTIQDMWGKRWSGHFSVTADQLDKNLAKLRMNQNTYAPDGSITTKIIYTDIDTTAPGMTKGLAPRGGCDPCVVYGGLFGSAFQFVSRADKPRNHNGTHQK